MAQPTDERSLGELFSELSRETSTLVRQEVQLAKTEVQQTATAIGESAAAVGAGGGVAVMGGVVLTFALVFLLAWGLNQLFDEDFPFLALGLSALIVGGVAAAVGYSMIQKGLEQFKNIHLAPERTIQTLKEDKEWLKNEVT